MLAVVRLAFGHLGRGQRAIAPGYAEVRRPLKDVETGHLVGDHGYELDTAGPGTDHTDPLPPEVHLSMRPLLRLVPLALKAIDTWKRRLEWRGQASGGKDAVAGEEPVPARRAQLPQVLVLQVVGVRHLCLEPDVGAKIEAVGDMIDVTQDLWLARVLFCPFPLLLQLRGEGVRVVHALHITAGTRIGVPVPGPAHAVRSLQHADAQPPSPQPIQHVQASEAGAYHDRIEMLFGLTTGLPDHLCPHDRLLRHGVRVGAGS